jgi:hypothetical protein
MEGISGGDGIGKERGQDGVDGGGEGREDMEGEYRL